MDSGLEIYKTFMAFIVMPIAGFCLLTLTAAWFGCLIESPWKPIRAFGYVLWVSIPLAMTLNGCWCFLQMT